MKRMLSYIKQLRSCWPLTCLAFTMAEILLSLTIIGVVAAITLPGLTGNINEKTWNTQRKALYARMSQAIALMPALNSFGTVTEVSSGASAVDTAAETFISDGLAKVLKINNICDKEHIEDCGFNLRFNTFDGVQKSLPLTLLGFNSTLNVDIASGRFSYSVIDTAAAAFETQNGESIVVYYNPNCREAILDYNVEGSYLQGQMCANFVYDLNGTKGPNTVGKDIGFITAINPTDARVAMVMFAGLASEDFREQQKLGEKCREFNPDSKAPNLDEGAVIMYNKNLIYDSFPNTAYWTTISASANMAYYISPFSGMIHLNSKNSAWQLRLYCIKQ